MENWLQLQLNIRLLQTKYLSYRPRKTDPSTMIQVRLVANNILQQIPTISLQIDRCNRYMFNVTQQQLRFKMLYNFMANRHSNVFFTKYNSDTVGQLNGYLLQLLAKKTGYSTKFYFNNGSYKYWKSMVSVYGFRLLPFAFYNLSDGQARFGIKDQNQLKTLMNAQRYKYKFIRGVYTNQELLKLLQNPTDPSQKIFVSVNDKAQQQRKIYYKDQKIQIQLFKINQNAKTQSQVYYNYICKPSKTKVSVDRQKLQKLRIQHKVSDKQLAKLFKAGFIALGSTGQTIKIQQISKQNVVLTPNFLILHYRTAQNIKQIIQNQQFCNYIKNLDKSTTYISSVVHIIQGDGSLITSKQFRDLRLALGSDVNHLLYNKNYRYYGVKHSMMMQLFSIFYHYKFIHFVHPFVANFMPNIVQNVLEFYKIGLLNQPNINKKYEQGQGKLIFYKNQHSLILLPATQQNYNKQINEQDTKKYYVNMSLFKDKKQPQTDQVKKYKEQLREKLQKKTIDFDPLVIFLGTSSQSSSNFRNVSGILIKLPKNKQNQQYSIIIDSGHGVYHQMINHFGSYKYLKQLLNVKILFLSHMHQDHCAGIFQILAKRNQLINGTIPQKERHKYKMFIIFPENLAKWFDLYNQHIQKISQHCEVIFTQSLCKKQGGTLFRKSMFQKNQVNKNSKQQVQQLNKMSSQSCFSSQQIQIPNEPQQEQQKILDKYRKSQNNSKQNLNKFLQAQNLIRFQPVPVFHCNQSYGLILQHQSSVKISYSGDCRPTPAFQNQAKDSTLLIHEATYQQDELARLTYHSTRKQAITVGLNTNSMVTALTHFSILSNKRRREKQQGKQNGQKQKQKQDISKTKTESLFSSNKVKKTGDYAKYNVFPAHDHLQFKLSQMYRLPELCGILQQLY